MANGFNDPSSYGSFVPTTNVWDVNEIIRAQLDPKLSEILVRLYQNLNLMSLVLNTKDSGFYDTNEFVDGKLWFPNPLAPTDSFSSSQAILRQERRKAIVFPPLTAGTNTQPHGITCNSSTFFTRIYGAANDTNGLNYIGLSYASVTANSNIELRVDATNVYIIVGAGTARTNFNISVVVVEYVQG